jgi:hypothetical protein
MKQPYQLVQANDFENELDSEKIQQFDIFKRCQELSLHLLHSLHSQLILLLNVCTDNIIMHVEVEVDVHVDVDVYMFFILLANVFPFS